MPDFDISRETNAPMYQTLTPFLEFYIYDRDILRSKDGKPRTLVSFSHTNSLNGNGPFQLQVFDPDYVAIEELILSVGLTGIDISEEILDAQEDNPDDKNVTRPVMFRYGYVSRDGEVITSLPDKTKQYFVGSVVSYTTDMRTNGVMLTIEGVTTTAYAADHYKKPQLSFYNTSIYDIIRYVCLYMDWEFVPLVQSDEVEDLPIDQRPEPMVETTQGIDTTEEAHKWLKMKPDETCYQFVQRICQYARPVDSRYSTFSCRLEFRTEAPRDREFEKEQPEPKGYLYFGPLDMRREPVRRYTFMRDPKSDVIRYTPTITGTAVALMGGAGMVVKTDDVNKGTFSVKPITEVDKNVAMFRNRRPRTYFPAPDDDLQQGEPQFPGENEGEFKPEGSNTGSQVLVPRKAPDPDEPIMEMSTRNTSAFYADRESMNYYLDAQLFCNSATLEIIGDPSPEITPSNIIVVFVFVPTGVEGQFRLHYTSSPWIITGVVHQISGGTYTTTLQLSRTGFNKAGVTSKTVYAELQKHLSEDGMRMVGANSAS